METFFQGKRYRSFDYEMKRLYGQKVVKLQIDGGFSCPNRENGNGCIFCTEQGSGEFCGNRNSSITKQMEQQKKLMSKWQTDKYIAYFQNYTNTYAPISVLKKKYDEAVSSGAFGLAIATRPDCLDDNVLKLLSSYAVPLWVELGLQSITCGSLINRGYPNETFEKAAFNLQKRNIKFVTHIIFGFPWESASQMLETVRFAVKCGTWGIKIHSLYIDKTAPLAKYYSEHPFKVMSFDEYTDLVAEALAIIPENVVIHRVTGDGKKENLIEPLWSLDKRRVLNEIDKKMRIKNYTQGCKL